MEIAQANAGPLLTGFELISGRCVELVRKHFPSLRCPLPGQFAYLALLELTDIESEAHAKSVLERTLGVAFEGDVVVDAVIAGSMQNSIDIWNLRERVPLAQAEEAKGLKHDISLPISKISGFIENMDLELSGAFPDARVFLFGHLGDGNLHYNVLPADAALRAVPGEQAKHISDLVYQRVDSLGGSISAEHGLG